MPNFSLTPLSEMEKKPQGRPLLSANEKFNREVKTESQKQKYEHHYRVIECSVYNSKKELIQIIVLYNGFGLEIASLKKTYIHKMIYDEVTYDYKKIREWDYVSDVRVIRNIALEHYFRRTKKRSKDGFQCDNP